MSIHLIGSIAQLKKEIVSLGTLVEEALYNAVTAIEKRDLSLANSVKKGDRNIDRREVEIEEECLKMLALYQPVAADLRFIVAALKLNRDLERIGDMAVNIAERTATLGQDRWAPGLFDFSGMAKKVQHMVRKSLDALIDLDAQKAREVFAADNEVDALYATLFEQICLAVRAEPERVGLFIQLITISRNLERIADHAANICKDVVYTVEGHIIRHRTSEQPDDTELTNS